MSTERPVITWSSEISIANFQIGSVFINKPQIWVLNNYILAWKTRKTTFHDRITVIFWKLHGFLGNDVSQVHKNRTHIEKRLLSVWKYKIIKYTVIFFCVCARTAQWIRAIRLQRHHFPELQTTWSLQNYKVLRDFAWVKNPKKLPSLNKNNMLKCCEIHEDYFFI